MFPNVPISWAGASGVNVGTYSIHGVSVFFMSREHTWRRFTKPSMVLDRRIYIYIFIKPGVYGNLCVLGPQETETSKHPQPLC